MNITSMSSWTFYSISSKHFLYILTHTPWPHEGWWGDKQIICAYMDISFEVYTNIFVNWIPIPMGDADWWKWVFCTSGSFIQFLGNTVSGRMTPAPLWLQWGVVNMIFEQIWTLHSIPSQNLCFKLTATMLTCTPKRVGVPKRLSHANLDILFNSGKNLFLKLIPPPILQPTGWSIGKHGFSV